MLYLVPAEFRKKYGPPMRAALGIIVLAIGIAIPNLFLVTAGGLLIVLAQRARCSASQVAGSGPALVGRAPQAERGGRVVDA